MKFWFMFITRWVVVFCTWVLSLLVRESRFVPMFIGDLFGLLLFVEFGGVR